MPSDDREKKTVTVQVYADQDAWLAEQAKKEERSKAFILRKALDSFRRLMGGGDEEDEQE